MEAAEFLVSLASGGNGINYCEPYSGTGTMTAISMKDIHAMENVPLNLVEENEELRQECARLREENLKLTADFVSSRDECEKLRVECEELRQSLASRRSNSPYLDEESFQEDDEKVKNYTDVSNFHTLVTVFT